VQKNSAEAVNEEIPEICVMLKNYSAKTEKDFRYLKLGWYRVKVYTNLIYRYM